MSAQSMKTISFRVIFKKKKDLHLKKLSSTKMAKGYGRIMTVVSLLFSLYKMALIACNKASKAMLPWYRNP